MLKQIPFPLQYFKLLLVSYLLETLYEFKLNRLNFPAISILPCCHQQTVALKSIQKTSKQRNEWPVRGTSVCSLQSEDEDH